jgi:hypothetical protein
VRCTLDVPDAEADCTGLADYRTVVRQPGRADTVLFLCLRHMELGLDDGLFTTDELLSLPA